LNIEVQEFQEKAGVVGLIRNSGKIAGAGKKVELIDKKQSNHL